jgi:hypothetical protein
LQTGHLQAVYFEWDGKDRWVVATTACKKKSGSKAAAVHSITKGHYITEGEKVKEIIDWGCERASFSDPWGGGAWSCGARPGRRFALGLGRA